MAQHSLGHISDNVLLCLVRFLFGRGIRMEDLLASFHHVKGGLIGNFDASLAMDLLKKVRIAGTML